MNERAEFLKAVSWMDPPPYPLLAYMIYSIFDESVENSIKAFWPNNTSVTYFDICDTDWIFQVALYEINVEAIDPSIDDSVAKTLDYLSNVSGMPSLFMFEAGFYDYRALFKLDTPQNVFGACIQNVSPLVATIDRIRSSSEFELYLQRARNFLVSKYPQIESQNN
ncbi:hypothetical protein [Schlesneria paludicola]|uniref:hypothetical protein n=1 Tax=Schlesneria paludicola TaxID=360056 RepID=UPI00058C4262|nr:hypothetical protein [Schlesneria paludicola]